MKKITLLLIFSFLSFMGYSQMALEGFESTTGPNLPAPTTPSLWTLGTGNWAVFDNGVGTAQRWGINNTVQNPFPLVYAGTNAAYMNRDNNGAGNTSEDYLATPLVTIPNNGQLRFFSRSFTNGNQGTIYQIRVAPATANQTDPAAYTTLVQEYTEDQLSAVFNVYEEKIIDLPTNLFNTQVYVAFVMKYAQPPTSTTIGGDRWLLDNARIVTKCLTPTTPVANPVTFNGASLSWANPSGATSWEIEVIPATATPTGVGVIYSGALPYVVTGLTPNTAYKFYVRALCDPTLPSTWTTATTFTTTTAPPQCGGNFVDAGGTTASYPANSDSTVTICPITPGDKVTVTFTTFNTEATYDGLYVYNGNSITSPQISSANGAGNAPSTAPGAYWGTAIPGPFVSTSADGCLTFRFRSDGSVQNEGWIANITCAPPPTCTKPINIITSAPTTTTVTVAWTQPANPDSSFATSWQILALPCGSAVPTSTTTGWVAAGTNPFVLTGLLPDTCYTIYVRGTCSATDFSQWSVAGTATTLIAPPACGGTYPDPGGANANYPANADNTVTICPVTPGDAVTVTFTSFNTQANTDGLYIFNGNSTAAPQISSGNAAGAVPGGVAGAFWGTANIGAFTSTSPDGCLTFRFRSNGTTQAAGWTSNVTCAPANNCPQPTVLTTSAVTHNSVSLTWTSTGTAWQVIAVPCGAPVPSPTATGWVAAATNPFVLNGLTPETCYDIYVRNVCSPTSTSAWTGPKSITTGIAPPVCGGNFNDQGGAAGPYLANSNYTVTICPTTPGDQVTVNFTSFNTEATWDALYVYDGNAVTAPQISSANGAGNVPGAVAGGFWGTVGPGSVTASGPTGCLTFRFRSDGSGQNAGWTATVVCAPPPTCAKPTNLTAVVTSSTTATLNWTQPQNPNNTTATAWQVIIQPAGTGIPPVTAVGITVTSLPYLATGLNPGTSYEYYVRAVCSTTDSGPWGGPKPFYTTITCSDSQPFCYNPAVPFVYPNSTGAPSYGAIGCLATTPNPAWYEVTVGQSGNINLQISQTSNAGGGTDVDFICWGPFTPAQYANMCNNLNGYPIGNVVTPTNVIACSYSIAAVENFVIPGAVSGNVYLVLITNYSNQLGTVVFSQTNSGGTGAGSTDCTPVCQIVLPADQVLCNQTSYTITSTNQNASSYAWYNGTVLIPGAITSTLTVTQSGTYTCVIQCGLNSVQDSINITFNPSVTPTFAPIAALCQNATAPTLPSTSIEGVAGTWSPPAINTAVAGTVLYTFTPNTGICASPATLSVTVNPSITPTFAPINNICQGATAPTLPATSLEGIAGTWSPNAIDTSVSGTVTYTFTPTAGLCATTATLTVTVTGSITTTFTQIPNICQNSTAPVLPTTSLEGVTGSWNAAIDTSLPGTLSYTFTPDASFGCASTFVMPITIDLRVVPTFAPIANLCINDVAPTLPTTSTNGVTGTWNSTISTTTAGTTTYTFTPTAGLCASTATLNVTVLTPTVPTFTQLGPFCQFDTAPTLPTISTNGIAGSWNAALSTATDGTVIYTFTPTSLVCTSTTTMTVVVNAKPVLPTVGPIERCDGYVLPALPANVTYHTATNGGGTTIAAGTNITTSQLIYVYGASGTTPNCTTESSFNVTITATPQFTIEGGCDGSEFVLEAIVLNSSYDPTAVNYSWTDSSNATVGSSSTFTATQSGIYTLTVTTPSTACTDSQNFNVTQTACIIQKGISPNGDGSNDSLDLTGFNVKQLSIFNRYGAKVYTKNDYTNQWYGQTDKGDELPDGTYYFVIDRKDAPTKSGWVYINRVK